MPIDFISPDVFLLLTTYNDYDEEEFIPYKLNARKNLSNIGQVHLKP